LPINLDDSRAQPIVELPKLRAKKIHPDETFRVPHLRQI
jgi:hypothetical protein